MKSVYRRIGIFFIVIYILSILYGGYILIADNDLLDGFTTQFPLITYAMLVMLGSSFLALFFTFISFNDRIDILYIKDIDSGSNSQTSEKKAGNHTNGEAENLTLSVSRQMIEEIILTNKFNKKILLEKFLRSICDHIEASVGAIYITKQVEDAKILEMVTSYAYYGSNNHASRYEFGQGLVGQVAKNGKPIFLKAIPEGYIEVVSGLGSSSPSYLLLYPVMNEDEEVLGVIETASFKEYTQEDQSFLKEVALLLAKEIETNEYYNLSL